LNDEGAEGTLAGGGDPILLRAEPGDRVFVNQLR